MKISNSRNAILNSKNYLSTFITNPEIAEKRPYILCEDIPDQTNRKILQQHRKTSMKYHPLDQKSLK